MDTIPYTLIACEVLRAEVEHLLRTTPSDRRFDIDWIPMGMHDDPARLHAALADRMVRCEGKGYAAILLLFGLCCRATEGLTPPSDSVLIIPLVHDCITLQLGSNDRFQKERTKEAGTFWFSRGFLRGGSNGLASFAGLGTAGDFVADADGRRRSAEELRAEFVRDYGEDSAEYLMTTLVDGWKQNYRRAVYFDWPDNPDRERDQGFVRAYAAENGWSCETLPVDLRLVRSLLFGPWREDEFVVVRPGEQADFLDSIPLSGIMGI